jgi:photosystem II stability/assembly factor-like uncharacterized protein
MSRLRAALRVAALLVVATATAGLVIGSPGARELPPPAHASALQVDDLHMVSAQAGWGVDMATGDILHTDGSASGWRIVDPPGRPPANNAVEPVFFLGRQHAWAVVGGPSSGAGAGADLAVARTTNAGRTWEVGPTLAPMTGMDLDLPSGDSMSGGEVALDFVNDQDGWLGIGFNELSVGSSAPYPAGTGQGLVLYHTTDGGAAWSVQLRFTPFTKTAQGLPAACALADVAFTSPLRGWETGECVALTQNGGLTWRKVTLAKPLAVGSSQWRTVKSHEVV